MHFEEYRRHDAVALAGLLKSGAITATELLDIAIARTEAVNPVLNAVIEPLYDLGRQLAQAADPSSAFGGVPFLVKDLGLHIKGTPIRTGCRGYEGYVSTEDSHAVRKMREAGLVYFGKTNTPEFGLTPYTEPAHFGPTRNPFDPTRTPGGSSGGSAAAVAAGIVPLATASDGGGSIRIPASCCGLFGIKPSRGRISLGPMVGEMWGSAVVEGCVSRTVRDSAAFLDALHGNMPGELNWQQPPQGHYVEEVRKAPPKLRIAFGTKHTLGHETDEACVKAVHEAAKLLQGLGHEVEEVALPYQREDLTEAFVQMVFGECAADIRVLEQYLGRRARPSDVEPATWALHLLGKSYSAGDYAYWKRHWNGLARRMGAFHATYDLLLTPTVATRPFVIGALQPSAADRRLMSVVNAFGLKSLLRANIDKLAEDIFGYIPFTPFANMTGQPSASVPLHRTPEGLPVGVMFTAAMGREDLLFRLAGQLEEAAPWAGHYEGVMPG